jgi:DNA-binding response OmpR family regulator
LLELSLPDGDGFQLCNEIREHFGDRMVIIFVTRRNSPQSRVVGIELGADDFMGKPCDADELLARIEVRMRRRSQAAL